MAVLSFSHVPPPTVDAVWPSVLSHIERGLRHGEGDTTTADEIRAKVIAGDYLMWAVHEGADILAAIVLQIVEQPTGDRTLFVVVLAGRDMPRWVDPLEGLLLEYRDLTGCDDIRSCSRVGMAKILRKRGWRVRAMIMEGPK